MYVSTLFYKNGGNLLLVGGSVRDLLMGISPLELDFEARGINLQEIKSCKSINNYLHALFYFLRQNQWITPGKKLQIDKILMRLDKEKWESKGVMSNEIFNKN